MARIEDFIALENTPCLLDDGSFVILRCFDFVEGKVLFDDLGVSRALSFAVFCKRLDPREEELSALLSQIKGRPAKKPIPVITIRPTARDMKRKEAFGKSVFLLPNPPKQNVIYRIEEHYYRVEYCEAIGKKYLASFKSLYVPTIRPDHGEEYLYRDCLSLLGENAEYVKAPIDGKESIVSARFAIAYFYPLLKEYVLSRKAARNGSKPLLPRHPSKETLSLLDSHKGLRKLSEADLNCLAPFALKELNRRRQEYVWRGEDLFFSGHVLSLARLAENKIQGLVLSSNESDVYDVSCLFSEKGKVTHSCSCPYGQEHSYCKHSLSLLVALCRQAGVWPDPMEEELKNMAAFTYGVEFDTPYDDYYEDEEHEDYRRYW